METKKDVLHYHTNTLTPTPQKRVRKPAVKKAAPPPKKEVHTDSGVPQPTIEQMVNFYSNAFTYYERMSKLSRYTLIHKIILADGPNMKGKNANKPLLVGMLLAIEAAAHQHPPVEPVKG